MEKRVITFGTFDVFHVGHVRILERAKTLGTHLTVGVSSDALNFNKKGRNPVYPERERMEIVNALSCVDDVFLEESLELKAEYIKKYHADVLTMGHDWEGRFDNFRSLCEVIYFPRTHGISTTDIISNLKTYD